MVSASSGIIDSFHEPVLLQVDGAAWGGLSLGYFQAADHEQQRHIWTPHPCVGVLTSGRARATIHSGVECAEIDIGSGMAGVFGPEFEVSRATWWCQGARRIFIELEESSYQRLGLADELLPGFIRQNLASPDPDLYGVMFAMVQEVQQGCPHGRLYAESLAQGMLRHVHRHYGRNAARQGAGTACLTRTQFQRVREYVQLHFDGDIGLPQLAAVAGVSRAHLVRLFRNTTGCSPHAFVISERVRQARRLLLEPGLSLAKISLQCGFSSQSHLSTLFRRATGMTPGAFRQAFGRG